MTPIKVLVVNASAAERELLKRALGGRPDISVVDTAVTPDFGMLKARQHRPDVVVTDVQIRGTSTPAFVRALRAERPEVGFLLTTGAAPQPAEAACAVEALDAGAADFVLLPGGAPGPERVAEFGNTLSAKIHIFSIKAYSRAAKILAPPSTAERRTPKGQPPAAPAGRRPANGFTLLAVGLSTGGPDALRTLIPALPASLPVPVVVVLHTPPNFSRFMADSLDKRSDLSVREAGDGDVLAPGTVYLAPGGRHLELKRGQGGRSVLATTDGEPVHNCKPSVDVFFRSAAEACGRGCLAAILTGMGEDGVDGLRRLKAAGARTMAQDEASSVVWGMPGAAVRAGCVDDVVGLERLSAHIAQLLGLRP